MKTARVTAATALAAALAGTACTSGRTPTTVITVAPAPASAPSAPPVVFAAPPPPSRVTADDVTRDFLRRFRDSGDPSGTPVQFTIRYLNALRAGSWAAAVREMAAVERAYIRIKDNAAAVGRDVLTNAAGGHRALPRCTSGVTAGRDAVVITCGTARVMVHVETWRGFRGVKVDEWFVARDHYGHPHTHAYTGAL